MPASGRLCNRLNDRAATTTESESARCVTTGLPGAFCWLLALLPAQPVTAGRPNPQSATINQRLAMVSPAGEALQEDSSRRVGRKALEHPAEDPPGDEIQMDWFLGITFSTHKHTSNAITSNALKSKCGEGLKHRGREDCLLVDHQTSVRKFTAGDGKLQKKPLCNATPKPFITLYPVPSVLREALRKQANATSRRARQGGQGRKVSAHQAEE